MKNEGNNNPSDLISYACDSVVKSITSDLALLGNALMTRINDPLAIQEFISFDSLKDQDLKQQLFKLNNKLSDCDSDDDRLKYLLEMHYIIAFHALGGNSKLSSIFKKLENLLVDAKKCVGADLKKKVSTFQVEALLALPGISKDEHKELLTELNSLEESDDLNQSINQVYEKINMHTQLPFDG